MNTSKNIENHLTLHFLKNEKHMNNVYLMKLYTFLGVFQPDLRSTRAGAWEESTLLKSDAKNQCLWCVFPCFWSLRSSLSGLCQQSRGFLPKLAPARVEKEGGGSSAAATLAEPTPRGALKVIDLSILLS